MNPYTKLAQDIEVTINTICPRDSMAVVEYLASRGLLNEEVLNAAEETREPTSV